MRTADSDGNVDGAPYSKPRFENSDTVTFIMADRLSRKNLGSNPHAAFIFKEEGSFDGKRLFLTKVKEESDDDVITAPLLTQGVKVDLPQAPANPIEREDKDPLIVTVDAQANLYLNYGEDKDKPIPADTLLHRVYALLRRHPDTPVLVRGDRSVPYGDVIAAMTLLQQAGAPSVGLVTEGMEPVEKRRR